MIRFLVFDIGNVLLPFDLGRALARIQSQSRVALACVRKEFEPIKIGYETGHIGRKEFLNRVVRLLQFTGTEADLIAAWEDIFEENHAMTRLVRGFHGRYPLYLLSNTNDLHVAYMFRQYPVFECFSGAVYSHIVRCFKPDPAIYECAVRQFGLIPEETVFIDDLPANVARARELGWQAIQYDYLNHEALVGELNRLGVSADAKGGI